MKKSGMSKEEIEENLIFMFIRGSQAYGTNNADSDEDFGGICLPSQDVILGLKDFDQEEQWVDEKGEKVDKSVYNVVKALDLLSKTNPNIIDFVFAPDHCIIHSTPEWEKIVAIRDTFISKKAKWAYQGYAESQLNRIKMHRGYLLNPPRKAPERSTFDLPDESVFPRTQLDVIARISTNYVADDDMNSFFSEFKSLFDHEGAIIFKKHIDADMVPFAIKDFKKGQREFLRMISSISGQFLKEEYVNAARNELRYLSAREQWTSYKQWKKHRNEKRQILEAKCGFDGKHAMHLIRLLRMSVEIMGGEGVLVDRRNIDRESLMEIRMGNVSFDAIEQECADLKAKGDQLYDKNPLPIDVDRTVINAVKKELLLGVMNR